MQDRIFDGIAERFEKRIYGSFKGEIRLQLLKQNLQPYLNQQKSIAKQKPLRILDAGGGLGQMSIWFAQQGHEVLLCDPSKDMLARAKKAIQSQQLSSKINCLCCSVQTLGQHSEERFDFIVFHAVLEWLADPEKTLKHLLKFLKTDGSLSLMFYNYHSVMLRNLFNGNFKRIRDGKITAVGKKGLTPINPLKPETVLKWLEHWQLEILHHSGIRTFSDYLLPSIRSKIEKEAWLEMEKQFACQEPYRSISRYIHLIARPSKI